MTDVVTCENCGTRFPNNPEKHRCRQKFCPQCKTPYTEPQTLSIGIEFRKVKESLQKLFSFKLVKKGKEIHYQCPKCGHLAYNEKQFRLTKVPEKVKTEIINNKPVKTVLSWRNVPYCPNCGSYLTRRRIKIVPYKR